MKKLIPGLIVILIACNQTTEPQQNELTIAQYFPLSIGNSWTYASNWVDYKGENHPDTNIKVIESEFEWEGSMAYFIGVYDGETGYKYDSEGHYTVNDTVLIFWYAPPDSNVYHFIMLKEPLEVGNWWIESNINQSGHMDTLTIISINETVSVSAGTFENCIKIVRKDNLAEYYIYAPDVGLVKEGQVGYSLTELIDYEVK